MSKFLAQLGQRAQASWQVLANGDEAGFRPALMRAAAAWLWQGYAGRLEPPRLLAGTWPQPQPAFNRALAADWPEVFAGLSLWQRLERLASLCEAALPARQRRQAGLYYTPGPVADFVVDRALAHVAASGGSYFDPACGSGLFLWRVFARWSQGIDRPDALAELIRSAHGCDTDALALDIADFGFALYWAERFGERGPQPALRRLDALAADDQGRLEVVKALPDLARLKLLIANPPYVGERHHKALFEALRRPPWQADYHGRGDLYYYFFFLALKLSGPETVCALLTPSYFRTATAARHLRQRLEAEACLLELVDFGEQRLFQAAGGHHSLLTIFRRQPSGAGQVLLRQAGGGRLASVLTELAGRADQKPQAALFCGEQRLLVWGDDQLGEILTRLAEAAPLLGEDFRVHQGIVSGADRLSPAQKQTLGLAAPAGTGVFVLSAAEAERLGEEAADWLVPWYKNSDIAAWRASRQSEQRLIYADRRQRVLPPQLARHLARFRPLLELRREVRLGRIAWWQLQWPREAELFTGPKLLLPQRARIGRAALSLEPWYASADVYFVLARAASSWSLEALCALLNSPLVSCWWFHRGKRKGALIELYQQPLSQTPLPRSPDLARLQRLGREGLERIAPDAGWLVRLHAEVCRQYGLDAGASERVWNWYCARIGS